jgi:CDP-diacylglycerol---serine O-phosphatidyltransferase
MTARATRRHRRPPGRFHKGIYIIPSLFTVANIFCGFYSLALTTRGRLEAAAWFILAAVVADMLDGRIARLTRTATTFGESYDSLADVISFGAAPALLAFQWGLWQKPRLGMAVAFLFLVAGSIRLARFNASSHEDPNFKGLPIPGGASAIALMVLISPAPVTHRLFMPVVVGFVLGLALLMVSNLPYRSFKDIDLRKRWPATTLFLIATVFALLTYVPTHVLAILLSLYIISAPVSVLTGRVRGTRKPAESHPEGESSDMEEEGRPDADVDHRLDSAD